MCETSKVILHFQVFYWAHKLYFLYWMLLVFHTPTFWKWFIAPATVYGLELIRRIFYSRSTGRGSTVIQEGSMLPSNVVKLIIQRPNKFEFCPGDWMKIKIPVITQYEWHCFTISSAPEEMVSVFD